MVLTLPNHRAPSWFARIQFRTAISHDMHHFADIPTCHACFSVCLFRWQIARFSTIGLPWLFFDRVRCSEWLVDPVDDVCIC
jgi:hypothetical protein